MRSTDVPTNSELPAGWTQPVLSDLCDINPPKPPSDALPPDALVTFVPVPAVDAESGTIAAPQVRPFWEVRKGFTAFVENDVIVAKITPCMENGKAAIARNLEKGFGFGSTEFHVLRPKPGVFSEFIYYFIRQESYREQAKAEMTGSVGQKRVPVDFIQQTQIPLAPSAEQLRIVEKIEQLLPHVTDSKLALAKTSRILKVFRQSVLAAACSGKLTEDWREANPQLTALSVTIPSTLDTNEIPNEIDLPEAWVWSCLRDIANVRGGVTKGRDLRGRKTISVPYLRVANVQDGYLDLSDMKEIEVPPEDATKYHLEGGDILFTEGGDRDKLGRGALWNNEIPGCIHQNHIFRARMTLSDIAPAYVSIVTKSQYARNYFFHNASQTVNLASINLTTLGGVPLALPPLEEQREIVRRVEALFKLADTIEKRVATAQVRADKLTQSILAKAFRGELVPTEAELARQEGREYEPASALLERIREERQHTQQSKPIRAIRGKAQVNRDRC